MVPLERLGLAACLFACLTIAVPILGQADGDVRGVVLDTAGAPLAGATITLSRGPSTARGAIAARDGTFRFAPVTPASDYRLTVAFPGLATVTVDAIEVDPGLTTTVPITLVPAEVVKQSIQVVARPDIVQPERTTLQTTLTAEFLQGLPILGRDYQDALRLAPGVSDVDGDGNPNIHGARDTDVMTLVDGVSTVDPLSGRVGRQLNIESIEQIEIKTAGADASYGRAQGGFVNVLTKSGGNDFEGSLSLFWRSSRLDGDGAGTEDPRLHGGIRSPPLSFSDYKSFLSFSGPLRKDRAWYFLTAEYIQIEEPVVTSALSFARGTRETRAFGKLSWDPSVNQKVIMSLTLDPQRYTNQGVDAVTALESGFTERAGGWSLLLKGTSIFSPSVFLESSLSGSRTEPAVLPTIDADTNANGVQWVDANGDGLFDISERDSGEDFDDDGAWDVFEDSISDNRRLDPGEDRDGDGRLTQPSIQGTGRGGGCEGATREDRDCDGHLDDSPEDRNGNGLLDDDLQEDLDGDRYLDDGTEDRNHNGRLDDRPFPSPDDVLVADEDGHSLPLAAFYPYERFRPLPPDRDYTVNRYNHVDGPYPRTSRAQVERFTLREDLAMFVPDAGGQHDVKVGGIVERERYAGDIVLRPTVYDDGALRAVALPAAPSARNAASSQALGAYVQDVYKPLPNVTIGLGLRFDRETTDTEGYTPFEPRAERLAFDRVDQLAGGENLGYDDAHLGNGDGILSRGFCSDPMLDCGDVANPIVQQLNTMKSAALSRLTQGHTQELIVAAGLQALYPDAVYRDPVTGRLSIDRDILRLNGAATFQERERFRLTNANLAPRLFLSWDPSGDGRTKLFANWSRFYDKLFLDSITGEQGPDTIFRSYGLDADGLTGSGAPDHGLGGVISAAPADATQVDRRLDTPFSDELTAGFERELVPEVAIRLTWISRKYRKQLQDRDVNHVLRFDEDGTPRDLLGGHLESDGLMSRSEPPQRAVHPIDWVPDGLPDLYLQNFFFNQVFRIDNENEALYHGVELELIRRLHRRWQMEASYTYSRAIGSAETFLSGLGDDPAAVRSEFGYLDYDQRHVIKANLVAWLPHDWQAGIAASWGSGVPYSVIRQVVSYDNYDYPQYRLLYGYLPDNPDSTGRREFVPQRRNSQRNAAVLDIGVRAQKSFVLGRLNSRLFVTVDNILNGDDLTVYSVVPSASDRSLGQVNAERRFGRRYEFGFQIEF